MALNHEKPSGAALSPRRTDAPPVRTLATYRRDPEATLPPTPMRELLASSGASIYVLSTDTAFVDVIVRAGAEQYPIAVVHSWDELRAAVESEECGIALLDATLLGDRIVHHVFALGPYAHRLVTLVAVDRSSASDLVGLLADRRIHRLLMKPAAVGATRLLIESAVTRRLELRELQANDTLTSNDRAAGGTSRAQRWTIGVAAGVVLLAAGAGVAWWELRERAKQPAGATAAAAPLDTQAETRRRVEDLRAQADLALSEGRLSDGAGTGALEQYLAILELAPNDASARNGAAAVVDTLFTRAEELLLSAALDEAAVTLDRIRRVEPASTRLAFLDAQLVRALAGTSSASAPAATAASEVEPQAGAAPTEIDSVLTLAAARLRRGQLLIPAGDNAREYLERARALDPANEQAAGVRAELATALIAAGRLVAAADPAAASSMAAEARRQGATASQLAALAAEVTAARRNLEQRDAAASLATARHLIRQGALFAPPDNHALGALLRLQADAPQTEGLAAAWAELRVATRGAVEAAMNSGDSAAAEAGLAALREAPEGAPLADELSRELAARREQERYLATPSQSSELRLITAPPAVYPSAELDAGIEGWVEVEFIVDRAGQTRDAIVIDARPRTRFDAAALATVAGYRYAPFEADGRTYERRVRVRVRFVLR